MNNDLIGLIPAAGRAVRLNFPIAKELWPIENTYERTEQMTPLIENVMMNMRYADCDHLVFITRADKPEIMKYVSTALPRVYKSYVCQTKKAQSGVSSGLVDAIDSAYHLIKNKTVLFGMPDTFVEPIDCYEQIFNTHYREINLNISTQYTPDIVLGLFKTDTPHKFGMVHLDRQDENKVIEIIDKPQEKVKLEYMWGIIVWNATFTEYIHKHYQNYVFDFASILNRAIYDGFSVKAQIIERGKYHDFGTQSDIIAFNHREDR